MTKYFVKANEDFPDSAHRFWLRKDQYTIGELYLSEDEANAVANVLNAAQHSVQADGAKCAPDQHDFSKSIECAKCGEFLF
jgi:hypothetical protein